MRREIPIRPYYVNKPFKFLGVMFKTDDVFPPQEMRCSAHRLIALANGRHLVVAKVVSDKDYEKAKERVERELAALTAQNGKETRTGHDRGQEHRKEKREPAPKPKKPARRRRS